jgi:uncharacterized repeat protein (TIGR01451 family)
VTFAINGKASTNGTPDTVGSKLCNTASSSFTYLDGTSGTSTSSQVCPTVTTLVPNQFFTKASDATTDPDLGQYSFKGSHSYYYTYPGDWDNSGTSAQFQLRMYTNATNEGIDFGIQDPLPCLDNFSGGVYSSNAPGSVCAHPAFIPTLITVYTGFTATAADSVTLIYTDGTTGTVAYTPGTGWVIPTSKPVAEIDLPPFAEEGNNTTSIGNPMELNVDGYAAQSAATTSLMTNTATANAYQVGSNTPVAPQETASNSILIVSPAEPSGTIVRPMMNSNYNGTGTCKESIAMGTYGDVENQIEIASAPSQAIYVDYLAPAGATVTAGQNTAFTLQQVHAATWYQDAQSQTFPGASKFVTATLTPTVKHNFNGTGRDLLEWVIPAGTITQAGDYQIKQNGLTVDLGPGCAGTYQNDLTVGYGAPITGCDYIGLVVPFNEGPPPINPSADNDLNYNGVGGTNYCGWSTPLTVAPVNPGFRVDKTVQGNLDPAPVGAGGTGDVGGSGGAATYSVSFTNTGQSNLVNPVMYDILPAVGDTQASSLTPRGSQFGVTLTGVGPLPAGVTVWYSQSTNPCRQEVLATDPGCVNDWSTSPPASLSSVKALKFVYSGTVYVSGANGINSFSVPVTVSTPPGATGTAWNTVGTNAYAGAGGSLVGAAESSPTGLQAITGPTITKASSTPSYAHAGDTVNYTFTVTNNTPVKLTSVGVVDNFVSAPSGDTAPAVSCQSLSSPAGTCSGATTTLQPNQTATFVASYTVTQADVDAGSLSDTATVSATPPSGPPLSNTSAKVTVPATESPAVSIVKNATVSPAADQGGVKLGDTISYTYTVKNTGNVTLAKVTVSDPTLGSVSCPAPSAPGLAPGASVTCTADAAHLVTQADIDRGRVDDSASAGCTAVTGDTCSPSQPSSVSVPAPAKPSVSIHKLAHASGGDTTPIFVGETISYSYVVTNTGNVTLASVSVNDPKLGSVTCPAPAAPGLAPGDQVTCTADQKHTVTQADVDSGQVTDTATAGCKDVQGNSCQPSPPSEVGVPSNPQPRVAIVKTAAVTPSADQTAVKVGDKISYSYKVTNVGNVTLAKVSVSDPAIGSVSCPTPAAPGLAPGASVTCTADNQHTVSQADVDAGKIVDTATAGCQDTKGNACPTSDPSSATVTAVDPSPAVSIVKSAQAAAPVKVGDTISYSYKITNTGNVTLRSVSVDDPKDGSVSCPTPSAPGLAPGGSLTCTVDTPHTVTQADVDAGSVVDSATADCADVRGDACAPSDPSKATVQTVAANPAVSIHKHATVTPAADQAAVKVGDTIAYTYMVTNTGNVTIASVSVDDPSLGQVNCPPVPAPGLAPGDSLTCSAATTHLVTQADVDATFVQDTATAGCKDVQGNSCSPSAPSTVNVPTEAPNPAITIQKVADAANGDTTPITLGEAIQYSYLVKNTGNVTLINVIVSDPTAGSVTCPSGTLAPGGSELCSADSAYHVTQGDINAGSATDTATVSCQVPAGPPCPGAQSTVTVPGVESPVIAIQKTAIVDPGADASSVSVGDHISYSYLITNVGNVTLQSVSVDDPSIGPVTCPPPPGGGLDPGQSETCTSDSSHLVTQADVDAGGVPDTATGHCVDVNNNPCTGSPKSSADVPSVRNPQVSIIKSATVSPAADQAAAKVGDKIAYSYRVTNGGNVTLQNVSVSDPTIGNVTCPNGALAPGDSVTCNADSDHTVTQSDVDAGQVPDTATVACEDAAGSACPSAVSSAIVPAEPARPSVDVTKTATVTPASDQNNIKAGDKVSYSYSVTNTGNVTLARVSVTDPTDGSVTCPVPQAPGLAPGDSITCTVDTPHTVTQADVDAGATTDLATADCVDTSGNTCAQSAPSKATVTANPARSVSIVKTATVSPAADQATAKLGDRISYSYKVTNTGTVDLATVSVSDPSLGAVTCPVPLPPGLAPGASETCTGDVQHVVSSADVRAGKVTDTATASGTDPSDHSTGPSAPSSVTTAVRGQSARLVVTKTVNHATAAPGQKLTYTITVSNKGPDAATGVVMTDKPSIPMRVFSVHPSQGQCHFGPPVSCQLGTLQNGARATVKIVAMPMHAGTERNSAVVTQAGGGGERDTAGVTSRIVGSLKLRKTASRRSATAGQNITYTLTVANPTGVAATHVLVCDSLPNALIYTGSSPGAHLRTGRYCWTIGRLAAHASRTFSIRANVAPGRGGSIVNHAVASASGLRAARAAATVHVAPARPIGCGSSADSARAAIAGARPRAHAAC